MHPEKEHYRLSGPPFELDPTMFLASLLHELQEPDYMVSRHAWARRWHVWELRVESERGEGIRYVSALCELVASCNQSKKSKFSAHLIYML